MTKIPFDIDKMHAEIEKNPEKYPTLSVYSHSLEQFRDFVNFSKISQVWLPVLYEMKLLVDNIS